jgi:Leucine-rich repeat (LRR) protein
MLPFTSFNLFLPNYIQTLNNFFKFNNIHYKIDCSTSNDLIMNLYNLFYNNMILESDDPLYLRFIGIYYKINNELDKMKEYYIRSYENNNMIIDLDNLPNYDFSWIHTLTQLQSLNLSNNELTIYPECINTLVQLDTLNLSVNNLTILPESIGLLTQLNTLNLSVNNLSTLPESIGLLTQLDTLFLIKNKLIEIPESIGSLTQLQTLYLFHNDLNKLPDSIGSLKELQILNVSYNNLKEIPSSIYKLNKLLLLNISNNKIDKLSNDICKLGQLYKLFINNNELTELPDDIKNLTQLNNLDLANNQIIKLSDNIGYLTQLYNLALHNNKLIELPNSIGNLVQLNNLDLADNELIKLPNTINYLTQLQDLSLHNNKLVELPDNIIYLTQLTDLRLSNNNLIKLPDNMENLTLLRLLWLFPNFSLDNQNDINIINPMHKLSIYYKNVEKNNEKTIKFLLLAYEQEDDDISIIKDIISYYKSINNFELVIKYLLFGIKLNYTMILDDETKLFINNMIKIPQELEEYIIDLLLTKKSMSWSYLMCKKYNIKNYKITDLIQIIDNKMKIKKIDECPICYENTDLIPYECFGHYYCLDCMYKSMYKTNQCALCKINPIESNRKRKRDE